MGTSQPYSAPSTPQWSSLKNLVTRVTRTGGVSAEDARRIVARFVTALGDMRAHSPQGGAGTGQLGPGPFASVSNEPILTLLRFIRFVDQVHQGGFAAAVAPHLQGVPTPQQKDLVLALLNGLGPEGCALIDVDARYALLHILKMKMGQPADTVEMYAQEFTADTGARLDQLIREYLGAYLEHALRRFLYEHLTERVGHDEALGSIASTTQALWQQVNAFPAPQLPTGGWDSENGHQVLTSYLSTLAQHVGLKV